MWRSQGSIGVFLLSKPQNIKDSSYSEAHSMTHRLVSRSLSERWTLNRDSALNCATQKSITWMSNRKIPCTHELWLQPLFSKLHFSWYEDTSTSFTQPLIPRACVQHSKHSAPILPKECFQRLIRYQHPLWTHSNQPQHYLVFTSKADHGRPALNHKHDGLLQFTSTHLYAATRWIELH